MARRDTGELQLSQTHIPVVPPPPAIQVEGLSKQFSGSTVPTISDLTFSLDAGELLVLLGPSGSGKTTILRLIAGFETPDEGRISIGGRLVWGGTADKDEPAERRRIGMVFQDYALFPHLTVAKNVEFGLHGWRESLRKSRLAEMLELTRLSGLASRHPHQLSGGQQQRAALARALAPAPSVLLLDEPFSNLDRELRDRLRDELRALLKSAGASALFVTHDRDDALALADRIAVIVDGQLMQLGLPSDLYLSPDTPGVAALLGPADFLGGIADVDGVTTEGIFLNLDEPPPPGTRLELMVRPHSWGVSPDPAGPAIVIERRFGGSQNIYRIAFPSGREIDVSQPLNVVISPGSRVGLSIDSNQVACFPEGPGLL